MAEISKYPAYAMGRIFQHHNRTAGDGVNHSNTDIDPERTYLNYHIKKGTPNDLKKRLSELFYIKKKSTKIFGEVIVTLPKNVKEADMRDFFLSVYDFYAKDFGEENIVNAVIHMDEKGMKNPHLHLDFIPVVKGEPEYVSASALKEVENWKKTHGGQAPKERVCMREFVTRNYLRSMHQRLSDYVEEALGYKTDILNGATENGNRTVLSLKNDSLQKEILKMQEKREHLSGEIKYILDTAKNSGVKESDLSLYPLLQKIEDLENQNAVLKGIMARNGYKYSKEDLESIKSKKYIPSKSVSVNVYNSRLEEVEIDNNGVVVIELPKGKPSPQSSLLERDADLKKQSDFAFQLDEDVVVRRSRTSRKTYVFLKTDTEENTLTSLLRLEEELKRLDLAGRKVYLEKIETDKYDLAKSILTKEEIDSLYFIGVNNLEKAYEKGLEKEQ